MARKFKLMMVAGSVTSKPHVQKSPDAMAASNDPLEGSQLSYVNVLPGETRLMPLPVWTSSAAMAELDDVEDRDVVASVPYWRIQPGVRPGVGKVGNAVGTGVGDRDGGNVGAGVGSNDGTGVGKVVGGNVGRGVGRGVGKGVGNSVGGNVGEAVSDTSAHSRMELPPAFGSGLSAKVPYVEILL